MQRGFGVITKEKEESPEPQTSSSGVIIRGGRKAPPGTRFRKRKVGDRVRLRDNRSGIIIKIRTNGHERYLIDIPGTGSRWFSESDVKD